jgi:hypothetical protein
MTNEKNTINSIAAYSAGRAAEEEIKNLSNEDFAGALVHAVEWWRNITAKIHAEGVRDWNAKCGKDVRDLSRNANELINAIAIVSLYKATLHITGCTHSLAVADNLAEIALKMHEDELRNGLAGWAGDILS